MTKPAAPAQVDPGDGVPAAVLARYAALVGASSRPLSGGLINDTYLVEGRVRAVVQRLHPIFGGEVNEDIDVVTRHLASRGLVTPRLIRTDAGEAFVPHEDRPWRAMDYVPGVTVGRLARPEQATEAGALVGRFHAAVADLEHRYVHTRGNVHDTPRHLAKLRTALDAHADHPLHGEVAALAAQLLEHAAALPDLSGLPLRHSHGDLKASNLRFDEQGAGLCLLDLDTLSPMIWPFEMGDALRSWCNPGGEDEGEVHFDIDFFEAALSGYAESARGLHSAEEKAALVEGLRIIALELAARFLADALEEQYFGFDAARFATRGAHNLARGRGQWALYRSVTAQQREAEARVARRLGP